MVEITLDKKRFIEFDTNAICEAEKAAGIVFLEWSGSITDRLPTIGVIRGFLYAGLRNDDPKITLQHVGKLCHPNKWVEIWEKVAEALAEYMGVDDRPSPLADSPGSSSEPSPDSTSGSPAKNSVN